MIYTLKDMHKVWRASDTDSDNYIVLKSKELALACDWFDSPTVVTPNVHKLTPEEVGILDSGNGLYNQAHNTPITRVWKEGMYQRGFKRLIPCG